MTITAANKFSDFAPYADVLTDESDKKLKQAAERTYKPCFMLTLNEFWGCLHGNFELLGDMSEPSVLQVYWLKRFADFCEEFSNTCERLQTTEEKDGNLFTGCVQLQPEESMLLFVRSYFGLKTFAEAGECTIGEYVLARKDRYNEWRMRKNYEAKQMQNIKRNAR